MPGIPATGSVSMSALNTEFSGGNSLSGYRNKTIYDSSTNAATTIAASGAISFSQFQGKRALAPPGAIATAPVITLMTISGATVTWSASANATDYHLLVGIGAGDGSVYDAFINSTAITKTISATFTPGTSYYASVAGKNAAGQGTINSPTTAYIVCATPTGVTLSVFSIPTTWNISWIAVSYATMYTWALSTSSTNTGTPVLTGTTTNITSGDQVVTLTPSTTYYAFVYATRTESTSPYGTANYIIPAVPVATANTPTISAGVLNYSWSGINEPIIYYVKLYMTGNSTALRSFTCPPITTSISSSLSLTIGATYYITVSAGNYGGTSPTVQSSASVAYNPPVASASVSIAAGVLTYTWSGTNSPTSYTVSLTNTTTNTIVAGPNSYSAAGSATYSSLTSGNSYTCSVSATNAQATSATTTSSAVTYIAPPVATAYTPTISAGVLTYTWSGTNSPTSYSVNLYRSGSATALATQTSGTSATYSSLTAGYVYYITVAATNAAGTSTLVTSGTVTYNPPVASSSVSIAAGVLTYTWSGTNSPTSYTVSLTNATTNTVVAGPNSYSAAGSATYSSLTSGNSYMCGVYATNAQATGYIDASFTYSPPVATANTPTISAGVLTYTWSGTNSPTSYSVNLYRSGSATALATQTTGTSATYSLLTSGYVYSITVAATNAQGTSVLATSGTVTYSPPTTPTGVAIKIAHGNGSGGIRVSWTAVSGATSYSLTNGTTTVTPTGTSGFLPLKADGSKQFITVTAVNDQGTSAASASTGISYFPGKSSYYTWTGVGSCKVTLAGAGGANGGSGGLVSGTFASSSSTWYIIAGTAGNGSAGGYGGGGAPYTGGFPGGGGGGGCSCMSSSSTAPLTSMYVTAGGGGGFGYLPGFAYVIGSHSGTNSSTTTFGVGADGIAGNTGGGGGGYYGGLKSGGGTNYVANLTSSSTNASGGGKSSQNGYVIITWGSVTPTLINPVSVTPYMNIWFDAADSTTVTGTTSVSAWESKGSRIRSTAGPRTGTTSYITANQNGLNIIRCGAGVDMTFGFDAPEQSRAWFIVAKNTTQLVSSGWGQYWTLVNQTQGVYQDAPSGPNYAGGAYEMGEGPSARGPNIVATTNNNPYNAWNCYTWVNSATAANNYIGINTTSYTLTTSLPAGGTNSSSTGWSYRTDSVTYSINTSGYGTGADIGEIIMYNDEITSTDRDSIITYLMTKWGIV